MKPVFFSYGAIELSSYALMLSIGACIGFWLTLRETQRKHLDAYAMLQFTIVTFTAGVIGARGLSWLLQRELYGERPWWSIFAIWDQGGASFYGGLVLAVLAGLGYARIRKLAVWDVADTLVVAWVPFILFIRIGCFLNGCCHGKATLSPLGMVAGGSPNNVSFGIPSHPAQLYAVGAMLVIFALLWWMRRHRRFAGQLTVTFLILYPGFTFFHEYLRGDPRISWRFGELGVFTLNQLISLLLVATAIVAGLALARRGSRPDA